MHGLLLVRTEIEDSSESYYYKCKYERAPDGGSHHYETANVGTWNNVAIANCGHGDHRRPYSCYKLLKIEIAYGTVVHDLI